MSLRNRLASDEFVIPGCRAELLEL